jgi:hypothetical protein
MSSGVRVGNQITAKIINIHTQNESFFAITHTSIANK